MQGAAAGPERSLMAAEASRHSGTHRASDTQADESHHLTLI